MPTIKELKQLKKDIALASKCKVDESFWPAQVKLLKDASDRAVAANKSIEMGPEKMMKRFDI